jgi:rSAM/selenodomain-associated transferase 1
MTSHLIVFAKDPKPGTVKTRLFDRFTPEEAAALYKAFISDTLAKARGVEANAHILCYAPASATASMVEIAGPDWDLVPQVYADLGERMATALRQSLAAGADRVILTGADIPSLPSTHLAQALDLLGDCDVVLGPSTDGGYYLIGVTADHPAIFQNIAWSQSSVFAQTVERVRNAGLSLGLVPPWYDVDTPEEVDFLLAHAEAAGEAEWVPKWTIAYLHTMDR